MYTSFFGFSERPFLTTPQLGSYFPSEQIEAALQTVISCVERGAGPALVIASTGTGKTTLVLKLQQHFAQTTPVVILSGTNCRTRRNLLQNALFAAGLPYVDMDEGQMRLSLTQYFQHRSARGENTLLLMDDADSLGTELLEELLGFSSLTGQNGWCVPMVLMGSFRLEEALASPQVASLNQRIAARSYIDRWSRAEVEGYIESRMRETLETPAEVFLPGAMAPICKVTGGVPRVLNQLCDHALMMAADKGQRQIDEFSIEEAWADLQRLPLPETHAFTSESAPADAWNSDDTSQDNTTTHQTSIVEFGGFDEDGDGDHSPAEESQFVDGQFVDGQFVDATPNDSTPLDMTPDDMTPGDTMPDLADAPETVVIDHDEETVAFGFGNEEAESDAHKVPLEDGAQSDSEPGLVTESAESEPLVSDAEFATVPSDMADAEDDIACPSEFAETEDAEYADLTEAEDADLAAADDTVDNEQDDPDACAWQSEAPTTLADAMATSQSDSRRPINPFLEEFEEEIILTDQCVTVSVRQAKVTHGVATNEGQMLSDILTMMDQQSSVIHALPQLPEDALAILPSPTIDTDDPSEPPASELPETECDATASSVSEPIETERTASVVNPDTWAAPSQLHVESDTDTTTEWLCVATDSLAEKATPELSPQHPITSQAADESDPDTPDVHDAVADQATDPLAQTEAQTETDDATETATDFEPAPALPELRAYDEPDTEAHADTTDNDAPTTDDLPPMGVPRSQVGDLQPEAGQFSDLFTRLANQE